jgi:hypothetical protein
MLGVIAAREERQLVRWGAAGYDLDRTETLSTYRLSGLALWAEASPRPAS